MGIRLYKNDDKAKWDAYVMGSDNSNCYHLTGWKDVIEKCFGHRTYYLLSEDNAGKINGILPIVHLKSFLFGNFMVSLPYFNYGGICADNEEGSKQLLDEAINIAKKERTEHIELRHTYNIDNGLPVKTAKVSMILELPVEEKELWDSLSSRMRGKIRKAPKEGMYSKIGREEELDSFYSVFSVNMRDLGTPVYPKEFFQNILNEFPDTTWICTIYTTNGQPVASGFLVGFKNRIEMPWVSSLKSHNRYYPNTLLYWSKIKFAYEKGFKFFDFGRSTIGEGTYKFKEQWNAKPVQLYWHYWLSDGKSMPELNPKNPKYEIAIKIWQKLPVAFTRIVGPAIVKNLP